MFTNKFTFSTMSRGDNDECALLSNTIKKRHIRWMADKFLVNTDPLELGMLRKEIIIEVLSCRLPGSPRKMSLSIEEWSADLDCYVEAVRSNSVTPILTKSIQASLTGLISIICIGERPIRRLKALKS